MIAHPKYNFVKVGIKPHPKVNADVPLLLQELRANRLPPRLQTKLELLARLSGLASTTAQRPRDLLAALRAHLSGDHRASSDDFEHFAAYALEYLAEDQDFQPDHDDGEGLQDDCGVIAAVTRAFQEVVDGSRLWHARLRIEAQWES